MKKVSLEVVHFGVKEPVTGRVSLRSTPAGTFALMFMSALNQMHVFRALSTGYVRGLTWETPLKKAKAVLEVFNSEHDLCL